MSAAPKLPAGYTLREDAGPFSDVMVTATAPDGRDLGSCGGGKPAGARVRAANLCWEDYGRRVAPIVADLVAALRRISASWDVNGPGIYRGSVENQVRSAIAKAEGEKAERQGEGLRRGEAYKIAQGLASEHGENTEYDRALAEFLSDAYGDDIDTARKAIEKGGQREGGAS